MMKREDFTSSDFIGNVPVVVFIDGVRNNTSHTSDVENLITSSMPTLARRFIKDNLYDKAYNLSDELGDDLQHKYAVSIDDYI